MPQLDAECISWFRDFLYKSYDALRQRDEALKYLPYSRERLDILSTASSPVPSLIARLRADPALAPILGFLNKQLDELQTAFHAFDDGAPSAPQVLPRHDVPGVKNFYDFQSPEGQRIIAVLRRFHDLATAEEREYFDRLYLGDQATQLDREARAGRGAAVAMIAARGRRVAKGSEMAAFEELRKAFGDGERIQDRDEFFLVVAAQDEWEAAYEVVGEVLEQLGFIPLPDGPGSPNPGYVVLAPVAPVRCGKFTDEVYRGPFEVFQKLAARAGEFLPQSKREQWPAQPSDPVSVWLTYLWWERRPTERGISTQDGKSFTIAHSWERPFTASAEAIEAGGLSRVPPAPSHGGPAAPPGEAAQGLLDYKGVAEYYGKPEEAVRKALERWRESGPVTGWYELRDPASHEPRFLYDLEAVKPVVAKVKPRP